MSSNEPQLVIRLPHRHPLVSSPNDANLSQVASLPADSLAFALENATSSRLADRYTIVYDVLIPAARRLRQTASAEQTEEQLTEDASSAEADIDAASGKVRMLARFLETSVTVILSAMSTWLDHTSQRYLLSIIAATAPETNTFTPLLLSSLHTYLSSNMKQLQHEGEIMSIIRVLSTTMSFATEKQVQSLPLIAPLINSLSTLMNRSIDMHQLSESHRSHSIQITLQRLIGALVATHPSLNSILLAESIKSSQFHTIAIIMAIDRQTSSKQSTASALISSADTRKSLVSLYETGVLSQKDVSVIISRHRDLRLWLASLTHEEFTATILPLVERLSKRAPELALPTLTELLQSFKFDLSRYHKNVIAIAVPEFRHADEARRVAAVALIKALVKRTSDVEALQSLLQLFIAHLTGKNGAIAQPGFRVAFVNAIATLSDVSALGSSQQATLSASVCDSLIEFVEKETVAEVRIAVIRALQANLAKVSAVSDKVTKHLTGCLAVAKDGNPVSWGYLMLFIDMVNGTDAKISESVKASIMAIMVKHHDAFLTQIKNATAKPVQHRRDGILAIALMLIAQSSSPAFTASAKTYLAPLKDAASFVNLFTLIESVQADDAAAYIRLIGVMFRSYSEQFNKDSEAFAPLLQTIVRLSVHKLQSVRRSVIQAVDPLVRLSGNERAVASLVSAFSTVLKAKNAELTVSNVWARALIALCSISRLPSTALPLLSFVACDPLVTSAERADSKVFAMIDRLVESTEQKFTEQIAAVAELITGASGLRGDAARGHQTAQTMFVSLFSSHPLLAASLPITTPMLAFLTTPTSIGEYESAVFNTPEGTLCTFKREGDFVAVVAENKNVKGRKKEDEEFDRIKKELDKKKGKIDNETKAKIDEQTVLRQKITQAIAKARAVLSLITSATRCQPQLVADHLLPFVLAPIYPLLTNPLIRREASSTHTALLQALDACVSSLSLPLALAVQLTFTRGVKAFTDPLFVKVMTDMLSELAKRVARQPFHLGTWMYVSPLVSAVLMQSKELERSTEDVRPVAEEDDESEAKEVVRPGYRPGFADALTILTTHCQPKALTPGSSFPLTHFLSLLLHLLNNTTYLRANVNRALTSLAANLSIAECTAMLNDDGILSEDENVRLSVLRSLKNATSITQAKRAKSNDSSSERALTYRMYLASHDASETVKTEASELMEQMKLKIDASYLTDLQPLLAHKFSLVRSAAAASIADALVAFPATTDATLASLIQLFIASPDEIIRSSRVGLVRGDLGEVRSKWEVRDGVAITLQNSSSSFKTKAQIQQLFKFMLEVALRESHDTVWDDCLKAGLRAIDEHGGQFLDELLPLFTKATSTIDDPKLSDDEHWKNDRVREGAVIFLGTIARHMNTDSAEVLTVMDSLIEVLKTPSHSVQKAVSECLTPLMQFNILADHIQGYIDTLLKRLAEGADYGERKGAAFGLAGCVKGLKLAALKKYAILDALKVMAEDKSPGARQGALFAYERLFFELGAKFEPYVVSILPHLLTCFGDQNAEVREAAQECAKMVMSHLTGHGVKMVLPLVLGSLQEADRKDRELLKGKTTNKEASSWRNKLESISMLGSLSYCAPQQLSTALPQIVPRLLEVMTDPNIKLQNASRTALKQIGSVIRNPEILALVPVLLAALNDPATNTKRALTELMATSFVHSVDPPSLALIVPIVKKGLRGRTAPTKKMAAQVVGSICSLIGDVKDILPYAPALLKQLKEILVDPIPEVRSVAARAMGSLYAGIREHDVESFNTLLDDLLDTLRSDTSSVERSGSAQGLAQVLAVEGAPRMRDLLPVLFAETTNERAVVREGFFNLFAALPDAFPIEDFASFLPDVFPVVVSGLADEIGLVRESALAAGQSLVVHYASTQTELILPALETGMVADDWRIRLSSVQLLGLLLLRVAGLSGKYLVALHMQQAEEDENIKDANTVTTKEQEQEIEVVIGTERRNRLFALMYLMRSDTVIAVREMAWRVWKGLVTATPRMLNLILPTLMNTVIIDLASSAPERQQTASSCLGELVVKLGDNVLTSIIPILQSRLDSDDDSTRQGVCLGLAEVIRHARKGDIAAYVDEIIPAVRDSLCDDSELVRRAAGKAFVMLYKQNGRRALDDVVPSLVEHLDEVQDREEESQLVLGGIREILTLVGEPVFPFILPTLTKAPMSLFYTKAFASLSDQFSKGFTNRYVTQTVEPLIQSMANNKDTAEEAAERRTAAERIVTCIGSDTVQQFFEQVTYAMDTTKPAVKIACAQLIASFAATTKVYFDPHLDMVLQAVLKLWDDADAGVVVAGWDAMETLSKVIPDERMSRHIDFIRGVITDILGDHRRAGKPITQLTGLTIKKGIAPLLPAFQYALLHGTPDQRVSAAEGLGELVSLSSEATLSSHVIKLTGPLIRIVGDRFPAEVKAAILQTLDLLIVNTGKFLKPFLPQLQTTFVKALQDSADVVRKQAVTALSHLMTHTAVPRVETVMNDLLASNAKDAAHGIRASVFSAFTQILSHQQVGSAISADTREKLLAGALEACNDEADDVRKAAGHAIASLLTYADDTRITRVVADISNIDSIDGDDWQRKAGRAIVMAFLARFLSDRLGAEGTATMTRAVIQLIANDHRGVQSDALVAAGELLVHCQTRGEEQHVIALLSAMTPLVGDDVALVRQQSASRLAWFASHCQELPVAVLEQTVPSLLTRMTDSNGPVKRASEAALYYMLAFHLGTDRAEKVINSFGAKMSKKGSASTVAAMISTAKKTLLRLTPKELRVTDELVTAPALDDTEHDE